MHAPFGRRRFLGILGAGTVGVVAVGTAAGTGGGAAGTLVARKPRAYVPPPGAWAKVRPSAVGWDHTELQEAFDYAGEHTSFAMTMVLGGKLLAEHSWRLGLGFARDIASVQKSVVALLVGNLQAAGKLRIHEPVTTYLGPGWSKATPKQEAPITVRHLLTMTSGLSSGLAFEAVPGSRWVYNTNAYQQLVPLVETVGGATIDAVTRTELFDPIGVSVASQWRDRRIDGPLGIDPNGRRIQGLVMTTSDMARVGLLVQRRGRWGSKRVLADPTYLDAALDSSQELNPSYGYLWWLNGKAAHVLPGPPTRRRGELVPTAPDDLVAALGAGDQKIYVSRSLDLVVTRTGASAGQSRSALSDFDAELWRRIMAAAPT
ncbi:MAG: serine hydrolase domain-containing protein [Acidimicrobiia bacterium]